MPLKRNKHLILLSQEHHFGLLFCWKIRQGLIKKIELNRIRDFVEHFWDFMLSEHFEKEEETLFEARENNLVSIAQTQHVAIRSLTKTILYNDNNNPLAYTLLADMVEKHIRFEEREVFPILEIFLSEDDLKIIGLQLASKVAIEKKYEDEFWI